MKYKNANGILPNHLLKEIQKYTQGTFIYIPITKERKIGWGQKNGTRETIYDRNKKIYELYKKGNSIETIIMNYNLSESSIRKIISKMKKEEQTLNVSLQLGGQSNE